MNTAKKQLRDGDTDEEENDMGQFPLGDHTEDIVDDDDEAFDDSDLDLGEDDDLGEGESDDDEGDENEDYLY